MSKVERMLSQQSGRGGDGMETDDTAAPPAGTKRVRGADSEPATATKRSKTEWDQVRAEFKMSPYEAKLTAEEVQDMVDDRHRPDLATEEKYRALDEATRPKVSAKRRKAVKDKLVDIGNQQQWFNVNKTAYEDESKSSDDSKSSPPAVSGVLSTAAVYSSKLVEAARTVHSAVKAALQPVIAAGRFAKAAYDSIPLPWYVKHGLLIAYGGATIYKLGLGPLLLKILKWVYDYVNPMAHVDGLFLGDTPLATVLEAKVAEYGPDIVAAVESGGFLEVSAAVMQKDIEVIMSAFKGTGIVEKVTQVLAETVADPAIPGSVILATMPGAAIGVPISTQVVPSLWDTWNTLSAMGAADLARGQALGTRCRKSPQVGGRHLLLVQGRGDVRVRRTFRFTRS